jgi:transposase
VAQTDDGRAELVARVVALTSALVVAEATGGYETAVVTALAIAQVPIAVVNPRQVRAFAKAIGRLAKTDAIDAAVIALFAERVRPEVRRLPDEAQQELVALVTRRRQLIDMLTAERNRMLTARRSIRTSVQQHLRWLERRIHETDADLTATPWTARSGVRRMICCAACLASARSPRGCSLRCCPSSARSPDARLPASWASRRSIATADSSGVGGSCGAAVPLSGRRCTWLR